MGKVNAIIEIAIVAEEIVETVSDFFSGTVSDEFYETLNKFTFLTTDLFKINNVGKFIGSEARAANTITNLVQVFLWGLLLFYGFRCLFSYFLSKKIDMPWQTFIRTIIFMVLINSAYFICFSGVFLSENITSYIREFLGRDMISFEVFDEAINRIDVCEDNDVFNIESFSIICAYFSIFVMFVFLGARFLILKILILSAPLFFCFGAFKNTEKIFYRWLKIFVSFLLFEILICLLIFSVNGLKEVDTAIFNIMISSMGILISKIFSNILKFSIN